MFLDCQFLDIHNYCLDLLQRHAGSWAVANAEVFDVVVNQDDSNYVCPQSLRNQQTATKNNSSPTLVGVTLICAVRFLVPVFDFDSLDFNSLIHFYII